MILDRVNSNLIEISFWGKIDADDTSIAERQDVRGEKSFCELFLANLHLLLILAKINCFTNDGSATQYIPGSQVSFKNRTIFPDSNNLSNISFLGLRRYW